MEEGMTGTPIEEKKKRFKLFQGRGIKKQQLVTDEEWKYIVKSFLIRLIK